MAKKDITVTNDTGISAEEKKKLDATRLYLIIFAAITAVALLTTFIIAIIPKSGSKSLDYLKDDLSKYVEVPANLYTNYPVTVEIPKVTDRDIEYEIIALLCQNKNKDDTLAINRPNVTISVGDVANIYYRGYILNDDGTKSYFDGGCNFNNTTTALEIGSGSFIAGFEYNLIGKNQKDYATMTKIQKGENTKAGDIINLTYSVYYADGQAALAKTAMIDLSDPDLDETWGEGFSLYFNKFTGIEVGKKFATGSSDDQKLTVPTTKDTKNSADQDIYFDMEITEAYRYSEGDVLDIEAYFPYNYGDETLNGKTAHFEVFIKTVQDYDVPEFNDEFVTEKLKKTAEDLASYAGETLADKYKSLIRSDLEKEYEENVKSYIESQFWKTVVAGSTFKKLPEDDVQKAYDNYVIEIQNSYANGYSNYYSSLDEFAKAYLDLGSTGDWKAKLRSDAEYSIKQKLAFYYIIREIDLIPNDQEYQALYDELFGEYLQSYLDYYGYTPADANYDAKVESAKKEILATYGESYWRESVMYEFAINAIIERASVTYNN